MKSFIVIIMWLMPLITCEHMLNIPNKLLEKKCSTQNIAQHIQNISNKLNLDSIISSVNRNQQKVIPIIDGNRGVRKRKVSRTSNPIGRSSNAIAAPISNMKLHTNETDTNNVAKTEEKNTPTYFEDSNLPLHIGHTDTQIESPLAKNHSEKYKEHGKLSLKDTYDQTIHFPDQTDKKSHSLEEAVVDQKIMHKKPTKHKIPDEEPKFKSDEHVKSLQVETPITKTLEHNQDTKYNLTRSTNLDANQENDEILGSKEIIQPKPTIKIEEPDSSSENARKRLLLETISKTHSLNGKSVVLQSNIEDLIKNDLVDTISIKRQNITETEEDDNQEKNYNLKMKEDPTSEDTKANGDEAYETMVIHSQDSAEPDVTYIKMSHKHPNSLKFNISNNAHMINSAPFNSKYHFPRRASKSWVNTEIVIKTNRDKLKLNNMVPGEIIRPDNPNNYKNNHLIGYNDYYNRYGSPKPISHYPNSYYYSDNYKSYRPNPFKGNAEYYTPSVSYIPGAYSYC